MARPIRTLRRVVEASLREDRTDEVLLAIGGLQARLQEVHGPLTFSDSEFKVFSQYGEDGIIQHLVRQVRPKNTSFVEIGVESYKESNTRFLALNDNWRGLAIDGDDAHVRFIESSDLGWRCDVQAKQAFVTRANVNELLESNGFAGDLGLLSIDVDGVDYWIWDAVEVVDPAIVIVEFNSVFGPDLPVTVPYDPGFVCGVAHWSHLYFGASISALTHLAEQRGYRLVGASTNAVNAFFVREDLAGGLPAVEPRDAWTPSRFQSSRDQEGRLTHVRDHEGRLQIIRDLELLNVVTGEVSAIKDLFDV